MASCSASGRLDDLDIKPHEKKTVHLELPSVTEGQAYLMLSYRQKKDLPMTEAGMELGFDQICLHDQDPVMAEGDCSGKISLEEKEKSFEINGEHGGETFLLLRKEDRDIYSHEKEWKRYSGIADGI